MQLFCGPQATSRKLEEGQTQLLDSSQRLELAVAEHLAAQQAGAELRGTLEATLAKVYKSLKTYRYGVLWIRLNGVAVSQHSLTYFCL